MKAFVLLILLSTLSFVEVYAQLDVWSMPPVRYNVGQNGQSAFTGLAPNYDAPTVATAHNIMYFDYNGRQTHFFVIGNRIFDSNGGTIATIPNIGSYISDIAIIPIPGLCNQFYILFAGSFCGTGFNNRSNVVYVQLDMSVTNTGNSQVQGDLVNGPITLLSGPSPFENVPNFRCVDIGIAVSPIYENYQELNCSNSSDNNEPTIINHSSVRFLYIKTCNYLDFYIITNTDIRRPTNCVTLQSNTNGFTEGVPNFNQLPPEYKWHRNYYNTHIPPDISTFTEIGGISEFELHTPQQPSADGFLVGVFRSVNASAQVPLSRVARFSVRNRQDTRYAGAFGFTTVINNQAQFNSLLVDNQGNRLSPFTDISGHVVGIEISPDGNQVLLSKGRNPNSQAENTVPNTGIIRANANAGNWLQQPHQLIQNSAGYFASYIEKDQAGNYYAFGIQGNNTVSLGRINANANIITPVGVVPNQLPVTFNCVNNGLNIYPFPEQIDNEPFTPFTSIGDRGTCCVGTLNYRNTTSNSLPQTAGNTSIINNQTINIEGTLTIQEGDFVQFNNCTIFMGERARIIINRSGKLRFNNTDITFCDRMWDGIYVNGDRTTGDADNTSNTELWFTSSNGTHYVEGAINAVVASRLADVRADRYIFRNNFLGIWYRDYNYPGQTAYVGANNNQPQFSLDSRITRCRFESYSWGGLNNMAAKPDDFGTPSPQNPTFYFSNASNFPPFLTSESAAENYTRGQVGILVQNSRVLLLFSHGKGSKNEGNTFKCLYKGVEAQNANLRLDNSKFIDIGDFGIHANHLQFPHNQTDIARFTVYNNHIYMTPAGRAAGARTRTGIFLENPMHVEIGNIHESNTIEDCREYGIFKANYATPRYGASILINRNTFHNNRSAAIYLSNNGTPESIGTTYIDILNNVVSNTVNNNLPQVDLNAGFGFYVNEFPARRPANPLQVNLRISQNELTNVAGGIEVVNIIKPLIEDNTINVTSSNAPLPFTQAGIYCRQTPGASVLNNTVAQVFVKALNYGRSKTGIGIDNPGNDFRPQVGFLVVNQNTVTDFRSGIRLMLQAYYTDVHCNTLRNNVYGLHFDNMPNLVSDGAIIGPLQPQTFDAFNQAVSPGNRWLFNGPNSLEPNTTAWHTLATATEANRIEYYFRNNNNERPLFNLPPAPFASGLYATLNPNTFIVNSSICPNGGRPNGKAVGLIGRGQANQPLLDRWLADLAVYATLADSMGLSQEEQDFVNQMQSSAAVHYIQAEGLLSNLMDSTALLQAEAIIENITPTNIIETYYQQALRGFVKVKKVCIGGQRPTCVRDSLLYLKPIADLASRTYGPGVLLARNLFNYTHDTLVYTGIEPTEETNGNQQNAGKMSVSTYPHTTGAQLGIAYPNPTAGTLHIPFLLPEGAQASLVVLNVMGQVVGQHALRSTDTELVLTTQNLPAGTYLYRLTVDNQAVAAHRFVVIK